MALSINKIITIATKDLTFNNAYLKVTTVQGSKDKVVASYEIRSSADGVAFAWNASDFSPDMNGENFIKQAYEYLKTLPEFANATDC